MVCDFHHEIFEVHTNNVEQTCSGIPACSEMEGLCENLWVCTLASVCSMHFCMALKIIYESGLVHSVLPTPVM